MKVEKEYLGLKRGGALKLDGSAVFDLGQVERHASRDLQRADDDGAAVGDVDAVDVGAREDACVSSVLDRLRAGGYRGQEGGDHRGEADDLHSALERKIGTETRSALWKTEQVQE